VEGIRRGLSDRYTDMMFSTDIHPTDTSLSDLVVEVVFLPNRASRNQITESARSAEVEPSSILHQAHPLRHENDLTNLTVWRRVLRQPILTLHV
jgi:hypothetical protein